MKKILLLVAKIDSARFIPLGIAFLASFCRDKGYQVRIYDELPDRNESLENTVKEFKPDIVGISCMTATYTNACEYAKKIKSVALETPVVFGGVHPTVATEDTLRNDFVDFVVQGEGEETLVELLRQFQDKKDYASVLGLAYKNNKGIVINQRRPLIKNLDSLPMPGRDMFAMDYYTQRWNWPRGYWFRTANLMSSRGCPYDCTFCGSKSMFGRSFRAFSIQRTVDEVEMLVKKYKFECLSFSDDTFAIDKQGALGICDELKKRRIKAFFRFQLRANTCDEDLIRKLREAGCIHIDIGAESGSDKILKQMKKGITVKQIKDSVATIKKYAIHVGVTFIIGSPNETMDDIGETRKLAGEIDADYTQFFIMTPYPGTELFDFAKKNNLFPHTLSWNDFRHGGENLKPCFTTLIPAEKLVKLREELNASFANKIARNYLKQPRFIQDVAGMFITNPGTLGKFLKGYSKTHNFGSALKLVLPHKL